MGFLIFLLLVGYFFCGTEYFWYYVGFVTIVWIVKYIAENYENSGKRRQSLSISEIDFMDGREFEKWCVKLLSYLGATNIRMTKGSGDQGVDIIADLNGVRYAIQCKRYSKPLGNKPIQEVYAGMQYYHCLAGAVMTNQTFTKGGKELALSTGVELWDRNWLTSAATRVNKVK